MLVVLVWLLTSLPPWVGLSLTLPILSAITVSIPIEGMASQATFRYVRMTV